MRFDSQFEEPMCGQRAKEPPPPRGKCVRPRHTKWWYPLLEVLRIVGKTTWLESALKTVLGSTGTTGLESAGTTWLIPHGP